VVADQIIGRPCDGYATVQEAHLQLAEILLAASIGKRDERLNRDTSFDGILERFFDFQAIKAEDHNLNALLCPLDSFHKRRDAVPRLNQQFQWIVNSPSPI
jgi:hypothetical protein